MSGGDDQCGELSDLLGVYALDAVEPDEAGLIAEHIAECPRCAQEYDQHRETIGWVASVGGPAPEGVWDRISAAIGGESGPTDPPAPPRLLPLSASPRPVAGSSSRRRHGRRIVALRTVAVAAAAVAALVMIGVQTARVDHLGDQVHRLDAAQQPTGVTAALENPAAERLVLTSTIGTQTALGEIVVLPSGQAYLVGSRMAALSAAHTYQLWTLVAGNAVSVGLLGSNPTTVAFRVDPAAQVKTYLITVEPAGGVVAPTASPIAQALA